MSTTSIPLTSSDYQLISQEKQSNKTVSKPSNLLSKVINDVNLVKDEADIVIDDILDGLTYAEFIR